VTFRAPWNRAARGALCALLALAGGWAIHAEIVFYGVDPVVRAIALVPTVILELALLVGLWRLWVVCLIVNESGLVVRNFRGDIPLRRRDISSVVLLTNFAGCQVALELKTGDRLSLDALAFAAQSNGQRVVDQISRALGLVSPPAEP
jgi:hypothetical protein